MLSITGIQFDIQWEDPAANVDRVLRMLTTLRREETETDSLIILPEMFATGFSQNTTVTTAAGWDSEAFLRAIAAEKNSAALGGLVSPPDTPASLAKNQSVAFDPEGNELARYQKNRTFRYTGESEHYENGKKVITFEWAGLKICPLICYDLRFPELFRRGTAAGAEVFVVIACWPSIRVDHWLTLLKARAIENLAWVIGLNRTGTDPDHHYPGRSVVYDPKGNLIADAGTGEALLTAHIDPTTVRDWRNEFPALEDLEK